MHRENKFRAWNYTEMIYNVAVRNSLIVNHPDEFTYKNGEANYSVMQFTGLLDIKGNEIYEGDLLKAFGMIYQVVFSDGAFYMKLRSAHHRLSRVFIRQEEIEIVGNIHQNPKLLK